MSGGDEKPKPTLREIVMSPLTEADTETVFRSDEKFRMHFTGTNGDRSYPVILMDKVGTPELLGRYSAFISSKLDTLPHIDIFNRNETHGLDETDLSLLRNHPFFDFTQDESRLIGYQFAFNRSTAPRIENNRYALNMVVSRDRNIYIVRYGVNLIRENFVDLSTTTDRQIIDLFDPERDNKTTREIKRAIRNIEHPLTIFGSLVVNRTIKVLTTR